MPGVWQRGLPKGSRAMTERRKIWHVAGDCWAEAVKASDYDESEARNKILGRSHGLNKAAGYACLLAAALILVVACLKVSP